ncbi:unnamed protein product [Euphydryas editha]|uniref:Uncharacterized protein n=1 Tax=Euphydryas editha TaxID=104508 RepID=A0AAU9V5S9_EUPED|nr:unnamed protein product [Euphydryas editha]
MAYKIFCEQMTPRKDITLDVNTYIENYAHFMYINMTENRKRSREEDTCEFMPLSKRINNLHIHNNMASPSLSQSSDSSHSNGLNTDNPISSSNSSSDKERSPNYDPGISSSESRYYYENKLLFELHLERIQRTGQQFPF